MNEEEQQTNSIASPPEPNSKWKAAKDAVIETGKVAAALIGIIGTIAAVIGVLLVLFPSWAPWTTYRATIKDAQVEDHNTSIENFNARNYTQSRLSLVAQEEQPAKSEADGEGYDLPVFNVVRFSTEAEGFQNKPLYIRWTLYEDSGRRASDTALQDQFGWPTEALISENRIDIANGEILVPLPLEEGIYFARVELWDKGDETWSDSLGNRIGGLDVWGNPQGDKTFKCQILERCEGAIPLSSTSTDKFEVKLDTNGLPRSTKFEDSGSDKGGEGKTGSASPVSRTNAAEGSDVTIVDVERGKAETTEQKELPKTGGLPAH